MFWLLCKFFISKQVPTSSMSSNQVVHALAHGRFFTIGTTVQCHHKKAPLTMALLYGPDFWSNRKQKLIHPQPPPKLVSIVPGIAGDWGYWKMGESQGSALLKLLICPVLMENIMTRKWSLVVLGLQVCSGPISPCQKIGKKLSHMSEFEERKNKLTKLKI